MTTFNVDATLFRACSLFTSKEETRYYLAGVSIEPHPETGALLVATDGHRCLVAWDPDGATDGRYIVKLDKPALAALKPGKHEMLPRRVTATAAGAPVWITDSEEDQKAFCKDWLVDGTFPDWRRVLPSDGVEPAHPSFNAHLLATFADVAAVLNEHSKVGTSSRIDITANATGPALIRFACTDRAFGVLMPMRGETPVMPDFMSASRKAEAA